MDNSSGHKIYEFGDFRLSCGDRMLYRRDVEVNLSPKAVETLIALIDRSGQIVSKDDLLSAVWPDTTVEESNLFLYLSILRKTLGTNELGDPWIETLRRRGYRFSGDVRVLTGIGDSRENGSPLISLNSEATSSLVTPLAATDPGSARRPGARVETTVRLASRPILLAALGLLAAAAVLAFVYPYVVSAPQIDSVAVMPLVNDTGDPENEFLVDGITGALISGLARVPGLRVQARTTVFRFKGTEVDPRTIGKELEVAAVLLGQVSKVRSNFFELQMELVDTRTGNRVWARSFNSSTTNLAAVERDLTPDLLAAMNVRLDEDARNVLTKRASQKNYTQNIETFTLFVKGQTAVRKLTRQDIRTGIGYLEKAIELDPGYAPAYAAISSAYSSLSMAGETHPSEVAPKAKAAALKAVELDETLAEGHAALATCYQWYEFNHTEAEKHLLRALELDPGSATVWHSYAHFLGLMGRRAEAASAWARAQELEPNDPYINAFGTSIRAMTDPYERVKKIRQTIEADPNFYFSHMIAAGIYVERNMFEEALAEFGIAKKLNPDQTWSDPRHIGTLLKMNKRKEAQAVFHEVLRRSKTQWVPEFNLAVMYLRFGEKKKALALLEKSYQIRDPRMAFLKMFADGPFKPIRDDPGFQDLMRRVGY